MYPNCCTGTGEKSIIQQSYAVILFLNHYHLRFAVYRNKTVFWFRNTKKASYGKINQVAVWSYTLSFE